MIARLHLVARLVSFAGASWIVAVVFWGLATGVRHIETPLIAVWMFIAGIAAQLVLWLISRLQSRA
jgi:hypothetical protein